MNTNYETKIVTNERNNKEKMDLIVTSLLPELKFIKSTIDKKPHNLFNLLERHLTKEQTNELVNSSEKLDKLIERCESVKDYDELLVNDIMSFLNKKIELHHQELPKNIKFDENNIMNENFLSCRITKFYPDNTNSLRTIACDEIYQAALKDDFYSFSDRYITFFSNKKAYSVTAEQAKENVIKEDGYHKFAITHGIYHFDLHCILDAIIYQKRNPIYKYDGESLIFKKWEKFRDSI